VNTDAPWPDLYEAESRVLSIQEKLHRWATDDRVVGSMTSTTSLPIRPSWWWPGIGFGAIKAHGLLGSTGSHPAPSGSAPTGSLSELRDDLKARRFRPTA
jgi:hypothetical protein